MADLTPSMQKAVRLAQRGGGRLVKQSGGYWTVPDAKKAESRLLGDCMRENGHASLVDAMSAAARVTPWGRGPWEDEPDYAETNTVMALARRGVLDLDYGGRGYAVAAVLRPGAA